MTKASKKAPYEIAADFGDMPPFEEYKWEEGDTSMFIGYKCAKLAPSELQDLGERAAYIEWLKERGFSEIFKGVPPT